MDRESSHLTTNSGGGSSSADLSSTTSTCDEVDERLKELEKQLKTLEKEFMQESCPPSLTEDDDNWVKALHSIPLSSSFEKVETTTDDMRHQSVLTLNQSSRILEAIALAVFKRTSRLSTVYHVFIKLLEWELQAAEKSRKKTNIETCERIVDIFVNDGPWGDEEWLIASKAFFAPIHVHQICARVPLNPHVKRYTFSQHVEDAPPVRIALEIKDYAHKK